ncbi:MAG: hypothetical protein HRT35_27540 [Algicola sp.]|nr:hypothetical protein [Algicola sp.]
MILLSPSLLDSIGSATSLLNIVQQAFIFDQHDPKLLAGGILTIFIDQILKLTFLIPGICLSVIVSIKYRPNPVWFRVGLNLFAVFMLLGFPLFTLVGIGLLLLNRKAKNSIEE